MTKNRNQVSGRSTSTPRRSDISPHPSAHSTTHTPYNGHHRTQQPQPQPRRRGASNHRSARRSHAALAQRRGGVAPRFAGAQAAQQAREQVAEEGWRSVCRVKRRREHLLCAGSDVVHTHTHTPHTHKHDWLWLTYLPPFRLCCFQGPNGTPLREPKTAKSSKKEHKDKEPKKKKVHTPAALHGCCCPLAIYLTMRAAAGVVVVCLQSLRQTHDGLAQRRSPKKQISSDSEDDEAAHRRTPVKSKKERRSPNVRELFYFLLF